MMRHVILLLAAILFITTAFAQTIITIQPNAAQGKDAEVFSCVPCGYDNSNYGTKKDFDAIAWTNSGNFSKVRSLMQFDLTVIPTNALITDARLSLYYNTTSTEGYHSGTNGSLLQRIIAPWVETTVTWNNQPATTTLNQISLANSSSNNQNYLNIDLRNFVMDMVANPSGNYGFMMRLNSETVSKKLVFASSDHITPALRPMLVITYTTPLPVNMLYFNGFHADNKNILEWATGSEINNSGFEIERSLMGDSNFQSIGWIKGFGNSSQLHTYTFADESIDLNNIYYYRLKQTDFDGNSNCSQIIRIAKPPTNFSIKIGPNPFKESTTISYSLKNSGNVKIDILNAEGKLIITLKNEYQPAGNFELLFDPKSIGCHTAILLVRFNLDGKIYLEKIVAL